MKHTDQIIFSLVALALFGCTDSYETSATGVSATNDTNWIATANPELWPTHGGNYEEQRFSKLDTINRENVIELGLAWYFDFDTHRGQESTPLMVNDVVYVTSAWSKVFALEAKSGKEIWRYDPMVPGAAGAAAGRTRRPRCW